MGAKSPIEQFYDEQLRKLLDPTPKSRNRRTVKRGAESWYGEGTTSALSGDVQEALARANAAEDKAGFFGKIKKAPLSVLGVAAGTLSMFGEATRGLGYGLWNDLASNDLKIDVTGDGVVDGKDTAWGQLKRAVNPKETVQGFGSFDPLSVDSGDGIFKKGAKYLASGVLDIGLDPLTYVTAGSGALGRSAASEVAGAAIASTTQKAAAKALAEGALANATEGAVSKMVVSSAADGVLRKLAPESLRDLATSTLRRTMQAGDEAALNGLDDAVARRLTALTDDEIVGLAAEELSGAAAAGFRQNGSTGLRKAMVDRVGKEGGEQLFDIMPDAVKGGFRFAGKPISKAAGGGRLLESAGKPGEVLMSLVEKTNAARNAVGGKFLPAFGEKGLAIKGAKLAALEATKEGVRAGEKQIAMEAALQTVKQTKMLTTVAVSELRKQFGEAAAMAESSAKNFGEKPFWNKVNELYTTLPDLRTGVQSIIDSPTASPLEKEAAVALQRMHVTLVDNYDKYKSVVGTEFSDLETMDNSALRVLHPEEVKRRGQTQEPLSKTRKTPVENYKGRTGAYMDETGARYLTPQEVNALEARPVFETDFRRIYANAADRMERGVKNSVTVRNFEQAGLLSRDPKELQMSYETLLGSVESVKNKATALLDTVDTPNERADIAARASKFGDLLERAATSDGTKQDAIYAEMAAALDGLNDERIVRLRTRLDKEMAAAKPDAEKIDAARKRLADAERSKKKFNVVTSPDRARTEKWATSGTMQRLGVDAETGKRLDDVGAAFVGRWAPAQVMESVRILTSIDKAADGPWLMKNVYEPYMKAWRTWATVGRGPGFVSRNVLGGMYNAVAGGAAAEDFMLGTRYTSALGRARRSVLRDLESGKLNQVAAGTAVDGAIERELAKIEVPKWMSDNAVTMMDLHREMGVREMFGGQVAKVAERGEYSAEMLIGKTPRSLAGAADVAAMSPGKQALLNTANYIALDNPYLRKMSTLSGSSETYLRSSVFFAGVRKNGTDTGGLTMAELLVKATQFDYGDLAPWEQKWLRNIAPFYVWTRNNVPLQMRTLVNRPGLPNAIFQLNREAEAQFGGDGEFATAANRFMPDFVAEKLGFAGEGKNPLMFGIGAPLSDLGRFKIPEVKSPRDLLGLPGQLLSGASEESIAQLNPIAKFAIEGATGKSLFTGAEYSKEPVSGALAGLIPGQEIDPATGERRASAFTMAQLRNLIPGLGLAQRGIPSSLNPVLANSNYDDRLKSSWLSSIGGLGGLPFMAPLSTATDSQIVGQASRQAKENNTAFNTAASKQGLDPERLGKMINRGATEEEIQAAIDSGWLLAPYKRIQLGVQ